MTERAEIERLLQMTGRTLKGLPTQEGYIDREDYRDRFDDVMSEMEATGFAHIPVFMIHRSDVIELLVGALRDALDERDAALAKVPKWISVEERMPSEDTEVLVYATEKIKGFGSVTAICEYSETTSIFGNKTGRYDWSSPWEYFHVDYKITHWMPLPKAPKEEQNETTD